MPLTRASLAFLDQVHKQNSKGWFTDHREEYVQVIERPMLELTGALSPVVLKIDPFVNVEPRRVLTRIHRDTRFSRDKTMYKRASWLVFQRRKGMLGPVFFFEFTPDFYRYGCGYYSAPPKEMDKVRRLVIAGDKRYRAAQKALDRLPHFSLYGDRYKRPRYPDHTEKEREWLERRSVTAMYETTDMDGLFAPVLAKTLGGTFRDLAPVYHFLVHCNEWTPE
ncbi:MAG: DUF2461 domain-containing protein [Planctomycetaceae bacterium]|nr:DUF2461 domain-containing protein [Planctomycetaceae bacterium]